MATIKIPKEDAKELMCGVPPQGFVMIEDRKWVREWRWGSIYHAIIQDPGTKKFYCLEYRLSTGDGEYTSADDWGADVELHEVEKEEMVTYKWKKVKNVSEGAR